jgi:hypothetical protein
MGTHVSGALLSAIIGRGDVLSEDYRRSVMPFALLLGLSLLLSFAGALRVRYRKQ